VTDLGLEFFSEERCETWARSQIFLSPDGRFDETEGVSDLQNHDASSARDREYSSREVWRIHYDISALPDILIEKVYVTEDDKRYSSGKKVQKHEVLTMSYHASRYEIHCLIPEQNPQTSDLLGEDHS